jgi:hypothetical protein
MDTLTDKYKYVLTSLEKLIIKGKPKLVFEGTKKMGGYIYEVNIDTIYFGKDSVATNYGSVFIFEGSEKAKIEILKSNLFILKRCVVYDTKDEINARLTEYYNLIEVAHVLSDEIEIISKGGRSSNETCVIIFAKNKFFWNRKKSTRLSK